MQMTQRVEEERKGAGWLAGLYSIFSPIQEDWGIKWSNKKWLGNKDELKRI